MDRWTLRVTGGCLGIITIAVGLVSGSGGAETLPGTFQQIDCEGAGWLTNIVAHPSGRIYGRTDVGGIYRSDDHGEHWRFLSGDFTSKSGLFVQGLAIAPSNPEVVYACLGTSYEEEGPERGIWKSQDGGATWSRVKSRLNFSGNDEARWGGECIALHPLDEKEVWAGSRGGGLWKSLDAGATWVQTGAAVFGSRNVASVCLHAGFPDQVWVGCQGGVWFSLDRGATWSEAGALAMDQVWRVVRKADGTVFVSGGKEEAESEGDTRLWRVTATDWSSPATYGYVDIWPNWLAAFDAAKGWKPSEANPGLTVLADGAIVAGSIWQNWARSRDDGKTWALLPLAYTGPYPAWQYRPAPAEFTGSNSLVQDPTNPLRWYFAGGWGPVRSEDGGATCRHIVKGIGEIVAWQVRFHPTDPRQVYLPVADMGLAVVSDGGDSGAASGFIYPHFKWPEDNIMFCHRPLISGRRIIAPGGEEKTDRARLYVSQDQGATWSKLAGRGLPDGEKREILDAVASADDPDDFLVCTGSAGGVFRTVDGGASFVKTKGLPNDFEAGTLFWWDIKVERDGSDPGRRYAMLRDEGLYVSNDRGASWSKPSAQPPDDYGWIVCDPGIGGRIWFYGQFGLYRSDDGGKTWTDEVGGFRSVIEADAIGDRLAVLGQREGDPYDQVYSSMDGGASWQTVSRKGYRFGNAQAVAVDPWRPGTVWISTNGRSVARFTPDVAAFGGR